MSLPATEPPGEHGLISRLLPGPIRSVEVFADIPDAPVFPEEEALIASAVERRRAEFATTRACAHLALDRLGIARAPILRGEAGEALWPEGIVGSLTHCEGYRAAAVARREFVAALGIDAEPSVRLPPGVLSLVALPREQAMVDELTKASDLPSEICWDHLLFSAKESVFKAWSTLTGMWLGFRDVRLTLDPDGPFTTCFHIAVPKSARALSGIEGRWLVSRGLILTTAIVPPL